MTIDQVSLSHSFFPFFYLRLCNCSHQIRAHPFYSSIDWLLYDNPHGPVRIPMNREKNEEEKKRELARETQRLQNEDAKIKLVLNIYRVLRGIEEMTLAIKNV